MKKRSVPKSLEDQIPPPVEGSWLQRIKERIKAGLYLKRKSTNIIQYYLEGEQHESLSKEKYLSNDKYPALIFKKKFRLLPYYIAYYLNNERHRIDGPALTTRTFQAWFLEGTELNKSQVQYLLKMNYFKKVPSKELPLYINTVYKSIIIERMKYYEKS